MAVSIDAQAAINEIAAELEARSEIDERLIDVGRQMASKNIGTHIGLRGGIWDEKVTDVLGDVGSSLLTSAESVGDWLGEAYYDTAYPVIGVGDTALALGSGMLNMTGSALATIPTILKSDDPLTKEGSKDWRAKLYETSEKLDPITWDAKTPMGKSVTGAISGAFELFNEGVAFPVGDAAGSIAKNVFGMDKKSSEKLSASVVGVLTGASGAFGSLRVRSKERTLPTNTGNLKVDTANARINAIANVQSANYLATAWKTIDPTGYAKAVKDRTALGKISEAARDMSKIIDETPIKIVKEGEGVHLGRMRTEITGGKTWPGQPSPRNPAVKRYEIDVNPEGMAKFSALSRELGKSASLDVLGHEFSHVQDALNYDFFVPSRNPKDPAYPTRRNPGTGNINPATGLPWSKWSKGFPYGMGTEGMPAVTALSKILEKGVAESKLETGLTNPTEVHSRLNNLQRTLSEKNMDFLDIIDTIGQLPKDAVFTEKVYEMPYDVMQLVNKIDKAVERGAVSKRAVIEMLVEALIESRVYHPTKYSLGIIGM